MSIANAAHCSMMGGGKKRPLYRYMKLVIPETRGYDAQTRYQYNTQVSKLDLIDVNDNYFDYPSSTTWTLSNVYRRNNGELPPKLLTHSVYDKFCVCISDRYYPPKNFPVTIIYDFKSAVLDTSKYSRWWIYTSNDTYAGATGPARNPSINLYFSADGVNYDLADSVTYNDFPNANYTKAFTRTLFENV